VAANRRTPSVPLEDLEQLKTALVQIPERVR
jgi:hypothetical protein